MATTSQVAQLPKLLTLGGINYNIDENPELKEFVNTIQKISAQTEKAKLYTTINGLKNEIETLSKAEVVPPKNETPVIDTNSLKSDIVKEITEKINGSISQMITPLLQQSQIAEKAAVADYRNKLLMENQGKIIPELVVGETKEALDKALAHSQEIFAKYGKKSETQNLGPNGAVNTTDTVNTTAPSSQPAATTQAPPVVNAPARTAVPSSEDLNIGSMTPEQFAKRRDELEAKVKALVNN